MLVEKLVPGRRFVSLGAMYCPKKKYFYTNPLDQNTLSLGGAARSGVKDITYIALVRD